MTGIHELELWLSSYGWFNILSDTELPFDIRFGFTGLKETRVSSLFSSVFRHFVVMWSLRTLDHKVILNSTRSSQCFVSS